MTYQVLIVDDEADVGTALKALLEMEIADLRVEATTDGATALQWLASNRPDLILSDYQMPGMDGLEFLQKARKLVGDVPSLIITAYPDPALATKAVTEAGVGLLVAKPMDIDHFVAVVEALLADPKRFDQGRRVFFP